MGDALPAGVALWTCVYAVQAEYIHKMSRLGPLGTRSHKVDHESSASLVRSVPNIHTIAKHQFLDCKLRRLEGVVVKGKWG